MLCSEVERCWRPGNSLWLCLCISVWSWSFDKPNKSYFLVFNLCGITSRKLFTVKLQSLKTLNRDMTPCILVPGCQYKVKITKGPVLKMNQFSWKTYQLGHEIHSRKNSINSGRAHRIPATWSHLKLLFRKSSKRQERIYEYTYPGFMWK